MNNTLKIKDMPICERPQEKLLLYGPESLSNGELLAIILRNGTNGENVLALTNRILAAFNGLNGLLNANFIDISKIKGVKKTKASQIIAVAELNRRFNTLKTSEKDIKINNASDIAALLINEMQDLNQEVLKLILLNTKNVIIEIKDLFKGSLDTSIVHPREIFKSALSKNCASIIMCHNHPSGKPEPSREDINITLRVRECGDILGIRLLDHIIIGKNNYISLKEKGLI